MPIVDGEMTIINTIDEDELIDKCKCCHQNSEVRDNEDNISLENDSEPTDEQQDDEILCFANRIFNAKGGGKTTRHQHIHHAVHKRVRGKQAKKYSNADSSFK